MIKIEIPDKEAKKSEYLKAVKPVVKERIELLTISTKHLKGDTIDIDHKGHAKYKHITRKIINKYTDGLNLQESEFEKESYISTVTNYLNTRKPGSNLESLNFDNLLLLLDDLLDSNQKLLEDLLVCEAENLLKKSKELLRKHSLDNDIYKYIIKQAFDYELDAVSKPIKSFFRTNNFVKICPYCNLVEVKFTATRGGRPATTHQLDHFFDKANFPLLACSFFNLVPSDSTCNGAGNKGTIEFTDKYHLNPYIKGFGKNLVFKPLMGGKKVKEIDIEIKARKGTAIRKQMLGRTEEINEDNAGNNEHKQGNVNVFMIKTKYKDRGEDAQYVLDNLSKVDDGMRAIKSFLDRMDELNLELAYKEWYKSEIRTPFDESRFNDKAFSKFNRDVHDYYYRQDTKARNDYIRDMINT